MTDAITRRADGPQHASDAPVDAANPSATADAAPGRSCPLHYHYGPAVFRAAPPDDLRDLDVLVVAGGLYGNELALDALLALYARERGRARLVFNGDFHWFDVDPGTFARVQAKVLAHRALRGNVETELAAAPRPGEPDAGCGCAYPAWVGDGVVERSNRILARLRGATTPALRAQMAALPMWLRADVGALRLGIVHGDAQSLAGWGFAQEHLREPAHVDQARRWFDAADVDAFASSHTCLPVFQRIAAGRWVFNNGAAGMPNFAGDPAGLAVRIATTPFDGPQRRFGVRHGDLFVDAIAITPDPQAVRSRFVADWPAGSDAHASYYARIADGPAFDPGDAVRD